MEPNLEDIDEDGGDAGEPLRAEPEADYRHRFARIRRSELLSLFLFVGGCAVVLVLMDISVGTAFLAPSGPGVGILTVGGLLVLAGAGGMIVNWRCPRCHRYLAQATSVLRLFWPDFWMEHCPSCGVRLR